MEISATCNVNEAHMARILLLSTNPAPATTDAAQVTIDVRKSTTTSWSQCLANIKRICIKIDLKNCVALVAYVLQYLKH